MSDVAVVIFAEPVRPGQVRELVESLGGERGPDPEAPDDSGLQRDGGAVWVVPCEPGDLPYPPDVLRECERLLGAPPRSRAVLDVSRRRGSEWLAAEIVLAAAERWRVAVLDFGEELLGIKDFQERIAERPVGFFLPAGWLDVRRVLREQRADPVTLVLPGEAGPERLRSFLRSMGAVLDLDAGTDAEFERGDARLWISVQAEGEAQVGGGQAALYRGTLGEPPFTFARMDVFDGAGSRSLAVEVVEALAALHPVLLEGPDGQLMTLDDLRLRVRSGAGEPFSP
ncbi:hypothetical protein [Spirillospora sp. NPDC029432]|uniref:hypothetical protein n=1 Tax=Spirillospora sp. NPDC029432 TaxID=3154599 RepID=UPI003456202F